MYPPNTTYFLVPVNSLKYECLSRLGKMMRKPQTQKSTNKNPTLNSTSKKDSTSSSPPFVPKTGLNLPIVLVQQIIDYLNLREIPVRFQVLCALLLDAGCRSFKQTYRYIQDYSKDEFTIILKILAKNARNLRSLHYTKSFYDVFPFKRNSLIGLKCLHVRFITSFEQLLAIFAACPNLIELGIVDLEEDYEVIHIFFHELQKPVYNKIRQSLQALRLFGVGSLVIRFIALFPNLTHLLYFNEDPEYDPTIFFNVLIGVKRADPQLLNSVTFDYNHVSWQEIEKVLKIFEQLQVLGHAYSDNPGIYDLTPNLKYLRHFQECENTLNLIQIGSLQHLKSLSILYAEPINDFPQILFDILRKIGNNLEDLALDLRINSLPICVSIIPRFCPNLQRLNLGFRVNSFYVSYDLPKQLPKMPKHERDNLTRGLQNLTLLEISCFHDMRVFLFLLVRAVNIERIRIIGVLITELQWTKLIKFNPLRNLRILRIGSNRTMSETFFIQLTNSLKKLYYAEIHFDQNKSLFR